MVVDSGMETDVPLVWPYLGEVLGAVLNNRGCNGPVTLRLCDFHSSFRSAGCKSQDLLAHTLLTVVNCIFFLCFLMVFEWVFFLFLQQSGSSEQNLREIWANESWSKYEFANKEDVDSFLKKHVIIIINAY